MSPAWTEKERLTAEKETLGFYISGHPLTEYEAVLRAITNADTASLSDDEKESLNAILDARIHAHGMTEAEAMALMADRGHQEEGEAAGKWRRAQLTSAQLSTYYVGYTEVADLAAGLRAARPQQSERQRHDSMLAHGSPPVRHLRTLIPG